ncbi:endopeptidase La [Hahella sp. CR1]|uniref:endopeptidase La n=1 Tax=Hahella sp. CR1 TaxID=2992807 RepID=UPI0024421AEC|nr:endopeptidase La [Hahella sp. CR1]MDG9670015.1 endopeptidase La [Hahella sp. CR1]
MTESNFDSDTKHSEYIGKDEAEESRPGGALVLPGQVMPKRIYLLPISNRPYFPAQVQPLVINANLWEETLKRVGKTEHQILGLTYVEKIPSPDEPPDTNDFAHIGCVVKAHNVVNERGKLQFIAQGLQRFRITQWLRRTPPYLVEVEYPEPAKESEKELKAYAIALINTIKELLPLNPLYSEELKQYLSRFSPDEPSALTDFAAAITTAEGPALQEILDTVPLLRRMEKVLILLKQELEVAKLQTQISAEVNQKINERQREFFLREQLKVIQKELGLAKDDRTADVEEFQQRMSERHPPDDVRKRFDEEIKKLSMLETGSPEYGVTRNYLDWLTQVPWGVHTEDKLDIARAREILDKEHDGLDDVKDRIIEFLAEGSFKGEVSGSILLLIGPPGVGKTSIGKSVAAALGRKFYRFSLGGMRDEAEIKGHRRTYIGAMPGKMVQALKDVGSANPVIMLDEIDKIGASYQGDPASALLETLDPEQNNEFLDHYLDVRLDLSKVLFVCTANQLDTIPGPLLDRMDVLRLSGYITEEKIAIAKNHLWPKLLKRMKLKKKQVSITDAALRQLIDGYAREAGVRNLEKRLHRLIRKSIVRLMEKPEEPIRIGVNNLVDFLGQPLFRKEKNLRGVGVVTGLAWTAMGGATLPVEAQLIHSSNRGFKLTGKLGDVMRESAEIAYSYVSAHLKEFKGDPEFFERAFVHLHVPEGATPKDGPSAGVTMATALLSLARNQTPKSNVAMTGELTLTGQVFPVGGIREKVIAAKRSGVNEIILPEANRRDYDELPEHIRSGLTMHFASTFQDVYKVMFG